jgi:ankyrin repeat protein
MVKKGTDVNHPDKHQLRPVHKLIFYLNFIILYKFVFRVAINDHPDCLDALVEANVDPNAVFMGERAISIAARQNRDKILKKLIDYKKTQVDFKNETGGTVLHFAAAGLFSLFYV